MPVFKSDTSVVKIDPAQDTVSQQFEQRLCAKVCFNIKAVVNF